MPRFVILEHTGAPDDPAGLHYDLLLEAGPVCRTWRLATIPEPDGPAVPAVELPPHRLAWLDHVAGPVSGDRGFARRIEAGDYRIVTGDPADKSCAARCTAILTGSMGPRRLNASRTADGWSIAVSSCAASAQDGG